MHHHSIRVPILVVVTLLLIAAGCSSGDDAASGVDTETSAEVAAETDAGTTEPSVDESNADESTVDGSDVDESTVDAGEPTQDGEPAQDGNAGDGQEPADGSEAGASPASDANRDSESVELKLLTHGSFAISDDTLAAFTELTGHTVEVVLGGDAGELVNRTVLTAGNPEADVVFGVDNTFLSAALDADVFLPDVASALSEVGDTVPEEFRLDDEGRVVPVDFGDVCLNYDRAWFADNSLDPPSGLDDLIDPAYAGLTVVQDPSTSSPGLAFLLATVDEYGADGFTDWWSALSANGVAVASGWEEAYYGQFTWGSEGGGDRPIVVSYASSPPAEVLFGEFDTPPEEGPTAVVTEGCYRQIEFAGVLAGTEHPAPAGLLVDFMLSETFQADIALNMFVFPVRSDIALPDEFVAYTEVPDDPAALTPDEIEAGRSDWIDAWDEAMAG